MERRWERILLAKRSAIQTSNAPGPIFVIAKREALWRSRPADLDCRAPRAICSQMESSGDSKIAVKQYPRAPAPMQSEWKAL